MLAYFAKLVTVMFRHVTGGGSGGGGDGGGGSAPLWPGILHVHDACPMLGMFIQCNCLSKSTMIMNFDKK